VPGHSFCFALFCFALAPPAPGPAFALSRCKRGEVRSPRVRDRQRKTAQRTSAHNEDDAMLHYAIVFFIIAVIAAVFGFTGIAAGAAEIAKILFYLFLVVFVVTLLLGVLRS
jgi:uncharacterized membrane protein YtjA (UPF0391 family)